MPTIYPLHTTKQYRPDIDGMRALAVVLVIIFHAFPLMVPGGFIGVDIFFIISGYLISGHILENLTEGKFSFFDFYARRIKRILPALIVVLLTVLVVGWMCLFSGEMQQLGKDTAVSSVFAANILYWREAGYFDQPAEKRILLHLWSLGIEEQFYILWPIVLVICWKWKQKY